MVTSDETSTMEERNYEFTNRWFSNAKPVWKDFFRNNKPNRVLEVGSCEGASACFLVDEIASDRPLELHCIDPWAGGIEHQKGGPVVIDTDVATKGRFDRNMEIAKKYAIHRLDIHLHKGYSDAILAKLLAGGKAGYFDFIYVDGSHTAPDVLTDAVLAFKLLKKGGVICFDDYYWSEPDLREIDPIRCPKISIDAFTNIFCRQLKVLVGGGTQVFCRKTVD